MSGPHRRTPLQVHDKHTSVILIIATIVSYFPQYRRLHRKRDGAGLSIWYLLLNSIATTEQLTLLSNLFVTWDLSDFTVPGSLIRTPPSITDWLNLLQLGITWLLATGLFFMVLRYRPAAPLGKTGALTGYLLWLGVSLAVVAFEATPMFRNNQSDNRKWLAENFMKYHFAILNPISVVGVLGSFFTQASTTLWLRRRRSFSVVTIALQSVVFVALAKSWKGRMHLRPDDAPADQEPSGLDWYTGGGWAVIHSGVFAAVQLGLLCVSLLVMCMWPRRVDKKKKKTAKRKQKQKKNNTKAKRSFWRRRRPQVKDEERMPLLGRFSPTFRSRATSRRSSEAKSPGRGSIFGGLSPTREGRTSSRRGSGTESADRRSIFTSLSPTREDRV